MIFTLAEQVFFFLVPHYGTYSLFHRSNAITSDPLAETYINISFCFSSEKLTPCEGFLTRFFYCQYVLLCLYPVELQTSALEAHISSFCKTSTKQSSNEIHGLLRTDLKLLLSYVHHKNNRSDFITGVNTFIIWPLKFPCKDFRCLRCKIKESV